MRRIIIVSALILVPLIAVAAVWLYRDPTLRLMLSGEDTADPGIPVKTRSAQPTPEEALAAHRQGVAWLIGQQKEDGSWLEQPGMTALALRALQAPPASLTPQNSDAVRRGAQYLLKLQAADGSFLIPFSLGSAMKNYTTALAVIAFKDFTEPAYREALNKARSYLLKAQKDEGEGYKEGDSGYGGMDYGYGGDGDLSNLQLAVEAVRVSGNGEESEYFRKAARFVTRLQDSEGNDQAWAKGSGGFVYSQDSVKKAGKAEPYGAMTFAGLKSLLFCGVDPEDPRVKDALRWLGRNLAVAEHPGRGQVSIYYYWFTMASALKAANLQELKMEDGSLRNWRAELSRELVARQETDGKWRNPTRKFMEGVPVLATSYALLALGLSL